MYDVGVAARKSKQRLDGFTERWRPGFTLRSGATRHVLLVGRFAIKVPRVTNWKMFLHGLLGNMQERTWRGFSDRLCPIICAMPGGWVLVMRRAAPMPAEIWADWDAGAMTDFQYQDGTRLPIEYKRSSLGIVDGRVVAVDYGT